MKRSDLSPIGRVCAASAAMVIAVTAAGVAPASASQRPDPSRVESTYQGMTGFFSDCPAPPELGTCIGYSVNARILREEIGRREYHDELVWVDGYPVTIDADGVHVDVVNRVMTSRNDDNPPRHGGVHANIRIDGASSGRVRATVTLKATDGSTHRAVLDVRVSGGLATPFADTGMPSALCPAEFATGQAKGVANSTATTGGAMSVDRKALTPANVPKVAEAGLISVRLANGVCGSAPG